jgi:lipoprotein-anchoring transpeptidase ErfK/SrfK
MAEFTRGGNVWFCAALAAGLATAALSAQGPSPRASVAPLSPARARALALQVALDRAGFSPGQIDGRRGAFTTRAVAAFREAHGITSPATTDASIDHALAEALGEPYQHPLTQYVITDADLAGPFVETIPEDMMEKAKLETLGYTSVLEALAERFHVSPTFLTELNPGVALTAGSTIAVPAVELFVVPTRQGQRPKADATSPTKAASVELTQETRAVIVRDASGGVLLYAPVTVGSEHDPLPVGDWKIVDVFDLPVFNYNPDLFWDADQQHAKARIQAGPNNPVGVVWIGIDREHFGFHGTPEPSQIGRSESHGCVRMTNWDALRLAALVREGTPVRLR